jgi:hypothetical protein
MFTVTIYVDCLVVVFDALKCTTVFKFSLVEFILNAFGCYKSLLHWTKHLNRARLIDLTIKFKEIQVEKSSGTDEIVIMNINTCN